MRITCFLPCRKGSERVKNKNFRQFGPHAKGLIEIKLLQLSKVSSIERILLSTNDEEIIDYASTLQIKNLYIHRRRSELCESITSTDSLVDHVMELVHEGHILWTHVTSPFLNSKIYIEIIKSYMTSLEKGYDSLMTVTELQNFI